MIENEPEREDLMTFDTLIEEALNEFDSEQYFITRLYAEMGGLESVSGMMADESTH